MKPFTTALAIDGRVYLRRYKEGKKITEDEISIDAALVLIRQLVIAVQEARRDEMVNS